MLISISPDTARPLAQTMVTLTGTQLSDVRGVSIGGMPASVQSITATQITATLPSLPGACGRLPVSLQTLDGQVHTSAVTMRIQPTNLAFTSVPGQPSLAGSIMAAAPLDGDDLSELVIGTSGLNSLTLLQGAQTGVFVKKAAVTVGYPPKQIVFADIDQDGRSEILTGDGIKSIDRFFVNASLGLMASVGAQITHGSFAIGRFDGDVFFDMAYVSMVDSVINIAIPSGANLLETIQSSIMKVATGKTPQSILMSDLNLDNKNDVACITDMNTVSIHLNNGTAALPANNIAVCTNPDRLFTGDIDGNGSPDLVVTCGTDTPNSELSVIFGSVGGSFSASKAVKIAPNLHSFVVADLNCDGKSEIISNSAGQAGLTVTSDISMAGLATSKLVALPIADQIGDIAIGKFNDDTAPDIGVVFSGSAGGFVVMKNVSD